MINIMIVHYNTPDLTECLVKSINKFTPDSKIYIFDNSDKLPFVAKFDNVEVIDNTNGEIIDFIKFRKRFIRTDEPFYSPKHCYTIQKFIDLYNIPFILLDSDVLLKKDISELYDERYAFIGGYRRKRIAPFICFINSEKLKQSGVKYFDENHMLGINGSTEDTGCMLYRNEDKLEHRIIDFNDYIEHYSGGSYDQKIFNMLHRGQATKEEWLKQHKDLYNE